MPGTLPDHSQTLLGHFLGKSFFDKNDDLCWKTLFAKVDLIWRIRQIRMGKMFVFWSSLFHVFTPTRQKYTIVRHEFDIWHPFSWKSCFSFRGFHELILHKNTSTSRRGARPQALFIPEKWYLKQINMFFMQKWHFWTPPPRRPRWRPSGNGGAGAKPPAWPYIHISPV